MNAHRGAHRCEFPRTGRQRGVALLEALIAILVFSIGVLGLIGLLGISVKSSADAKYRADAANFADQIIGRIWTDQASAAATAHNPTSPLDATARCTAAGGGTASSNANVVSWLAALAAALPGATSARQQITVTGTDPIVVTVTVCWHGPQDKDAAGNDVFHNYTATAQIAG
ncbi:MAG TPA: type IV pilus modification protein PilV [Rhodocyclaceae bacterium]|nr:MAG: type IV pilus modification protein PilV [Betaproteobacteria bacterium CG2_30_68_42]PIV76375.1 MAG: type IV pilus modification protein PilV [Rhodocyclales bacterium CG17_big_fil_post_rev_8_21_14_2_50_68_7]PIX74902.1 MAG: type IV pilus modification protein PilV [Rhodocyclales bacterium CG_4_10_14_3_um_filter_68_10]PJA57790.1 MAG: type IV pilus modification protein PilV [Rhodocyclales bacterium CG_4_9_14_3_um_filter_68_10]HCX34346.1 type IV pilus modification protein PilV [Rhodocyclaceae b